MFTTEARCPGLWNCLCGMILYLPLSRIYEFYCFFRTFQYGHIINLYEFEYIAETRIVFACGYSVADTVRVDHATLAFQFCDDIFV